MRALVLFAGAADGWGLGLHRAGIPTAAFCEIDDWRRATCARHEHNWGAVAYGDVRTVTADRLRRDLGRVPEIIVGSPPCQDISPVNARARGVDGDGMFFEFVRLVGECRPLWAAAENSHFLRTRGYDRVADRMEGYGYACWPLVVRAANLGAPHYRPRCWVVAANANGIRLRQQSGWGGGEGRQETPVAPANDRHAASEQVGRTGLAWADAWSDWNGGLAGHLRVADGVSSRLAGLCRRAYGDSLCPQIAEAIARSMTRLLHAREAA